MKLIVHVYLYLILLTHFAVVKKGKLSEITQRIKAGVLSLV
jgi:hypothetical protein